MKDIYGQSEAALDVTIIITTLIPPSFPLPAPTDLSTCYTESGVVTPGFAMDQVYLVGSVKDVKIHMNPLPETAS